MSLDVSDPDRCYRALRSRDARFDGLFFVAVTTTGVYCRPICPARLPRRERCRFFVHAAEAESAGFRACLRCRPELAPGRAAVDSVPRLLRVGLRKIREGYLNEHSLDELAARLGVTSRHLRRSMTAALGVSPIELAQSQRLALAKGLLQDSRLPLSEVALAAGFSSLRRFNELFAARFGQPPSQLRRASATTTTGEALTLRLDYRPPLPFSALLSFLKERAIPGVELITDDTYQRSVACGEHVGWVRVQADPERPCLRATLSLSLSPLLPLIVSRLRTLFDLDAMPAAIFDLLHADAQLRPLVAQQPGLRVPGAFDVFETATRAVLGQQVSVAAATTLAGRLTARWGRMLPAGPPGLDRAFPTADVLAQADVAEVATMGLPTARARTLIELARAVSSGRIDLAGAEPGSSEPMLTALQALPGIGPWTAQYLAMRALHDPDAFPAGDLGLRRALGIDSAAALTARAEAWRPFRSYAVMYLWASHSAGGAPAAPTSLKKGRKV